MRGCVCGITKPCFLPSGDIVMADGANHRICVFSPDGSTLKREFGGYSSELGEGTFKRPIAVSIVNGRLFMVDEDTSYVLVFE